MLNPRGFTGGKDTNLQKKIFQKFKSSGVDDQMRQSIQKTYEDFLDSENILLPRPERQRLFNQVFKMLLEEMIDKIDKKQ